MARNISSSANSLQYWKDKNTGKVVYGTALEYSPEHSGNNYSALGATNGSLDLTGVDTSAGAVGSVMGDDYYSKKGYTFDDSGKIVKAGTATGTTAGAAGTLGATPASTGTNVYGTGTTKAKSSVANAATGATGTTPASSTGTTSSTSTGTTTATPASTGIISSVADAMVETPEDKTVAGQLAGLLDSNSDYITQARSQGERAAAARGLQNSSIAATAGQSAAIEAALPIAQQDAQSYQTNLNTAQQGLISSKLSSQDSAEALLLEAKQYEDQAKLYTLQGDIEAARSAQDHAEKLKEDAANAESTSKLSAQEASQTSGQSAQDSAEAIALANVNGKWNLDAQALVNAQNATGDEIADRNNYASAMNTLNTNYGLRVNEINTSTEFDDTKSEFYKYDKNGDGDVGDSEGGVMTARNYALIQAKLIYEKSVSDLNRIYGSVTSGDDGSGTDWGDEDTTTTTEPSADSAVPTTFNGTKLTPEFINSLQYKVYQEGGKTYWIENGNFHMSDGAGGSYVYGNGTWNKIS